MLRTSAREDILLEAASDFTVKDPLLLEKLDLLLGLVSGHAEIEYLRGPAVLHEPMRVSIRASERKRRFDREEDAECNFCGSQV